jgi:hypothetical protein
MMDFVKRYYDGDIKSIIVDVLMFVIYIAMAIITYAEVLFIIIDVLIRHNGLDGRGTFVVQVLGTIKDQLSLWCGSMIKNYINNLVSDLDFRSDARL